MYSVNTIAYVYCPLFKLISWNSQPVFFYVIVYTSYRLLEIDAVGKPKQVDI